MAFDCIAQVKVNAVQFGKVINSFKFKGTELTPIYYRGEENNYGTFIDPRNGNTVASFYGKRSNSKKDIIYYIHIH